MMMTFFDSLSNICFNVNVCSRTDYCLYHVRLSKKKKKHQDSLRVKSIKI